MFKLTTILLCLGSALASDVDTYNTLVDEALFLASQYMVEYKLDVLPLPPYSVSYNQQKLTPSWTVTGSISTGPGTIVNATGIHRNGNADIQLIGDDQMVVTVSVSTDPMVATFLKCTMDFSHPMPFSNDGGMQLKLGTSDATIKITFQKSDKVCKFTVNEAVLTKLGSIDFLILPDTWWADIKDKGLDYYISSHNDDLRQVVSQQLEPVFQEVINKLNPCQYFPF